MKRLLLVLTVVVMASFLLVGCLPTTNHAPVITTVSLPNAVVGTAYTTTVGATDVDGDALTFSLISGPTDMVISEAGAISGWTPAAVGTEDVTVAVTDGKDPVSADYTITVEVAPIVNTVPVITAIADQTTILGVAYTYPVVATDAGDTLTYSLTTSPLLMTIAPTTGVITWTPEFATQLGPHEVVVEVSDGELVATEDFVLTVVEPGDLVVTIDVPGAYLHPTKGLIVAAACYDVVVTFSDSIAEDKDVWARWSDVTAGASGPWVSLTGNTDDTEFTGEICFTDVVTECAEICIEVKVGAICCDPIIYSEMITVDSLAPTVDLNITFEDCPECDLPGVYFTFEPDVTGDICDTGICCEDECSGEASWSIEDTTDICDLCAPVSGTGCPEGTFACGCLLYPEDWLAVGDNVDYTLEFTFTDNVGNAFVDTWTITVDSDSVVGFTSVVDDAVPLVDGVYKLYDNCAVPALLE